MDPIWIVLIVVGVLALIVLFWYIATMNSLRQLEVKVNEAESGIDVALTKRYDVLSKMVETVKGYSKHEQETFVEVVKWRNQQPKNLNVKQKEEFMQKLDQVQSGINVVVEQYPELKAEKVFTNLQHSISDVEEHLQASRRLFNANVSRLNSRIVTFPTSIVASKIGMEKKPFFEAEMSKRADVEISF